MNAYFPRRLFRWFLSQQILFSAVAFIALNGALLLWIESSSFDQDTLRICRQVVLFSLASAFSVMIVVSLWMARRLVVPLGRLIEKTRRIREFPLSDDEVEPEALTFDEPGEWYELERAVNRLGRDLRQKTIRLSREKTELRTIMSAVAEAVLAVDKYRQVLFFNPQFAYLFNVRQPSPEVRMGEILRSPDVTEVYDEVLKSGRAVRRDVQIHVPSKERVPRHFQLSVAPLKKKHNQEVYGVVGVFYDITEMKQSEKIRIEFVGNVSHELRTPLTTIHGYLQTLNADVEMGRLDQAGEFLKIVTQNVTRLKNLVEDLLDLSSLESGKELRPERIDVRDVTESVLRQVNPLSHKVHVAYDFEEMFADPKRLEQVLRNLMENAIRYVPEGRNIYIRWTPGDDGRLELRVKDDGPGISPEHQARLFERFYRVDESRSRSVGGTGIGLSLVKHIVQRHGGQVRVQSQPGQGAEFVCEFPVG
jgi:two-component system phosphate regulon sensor histidine kinase PhoR